MLWQCLASSQGSCSSIACASMPCQLQQCSEITWSVIQRLRCWLQGSYGPHLQQSRGEMESVLLSEAALELHAQASSAPSPSPQGPLMLDPAPGAHIASPAGHTAWHGLQAAQQQGGPGRPGLGVGSQGVLHRQPWPPAGLSDPSCPKPSHPWAPGQQPTPPDRQAAPEPTQLWTLQPQQAEPAQHTPARAWEERGPGAAADAAVADGVPEGEAALDEAGVCNFPELIAVAQQQSSYSEAPAVAARLEGLTAASPAGEAPPAEGLQWAAPQVGFTVAC